MRDTGLFDMEAAREFAATCRIYRRLENSLIGDLIGGVALFVILIAGLWIGAGLS